LDGPPRHSTPYMESDVVQLPVTDRLWAWFQANKKASLWGAGIVAVVGLVTWLVLYQRSQEELTASEALSNATLAASGALGQRSDPADAYLKVAATYPKFSAGVRALLLAAGSLYTEGKYEEAKTQFQRFTREHRDSPFMGQALLGVASCLDAQSKTNEAMAAYKELIERHPGEAIIPKAKFALACLYEAQNKPELALNYFEEVAQGDPYGTMGSEAGMKAEELKIKYPALVPPPPAPAATQPGAGLPPASATLSAGKASNAPAPATPASTLTTNKTLPKAGASK
jgi:tetratricopeptide (TPR) repeat protein